MTQPRRTDLTELGRLIIETMTDICAINKDCPTARTPFHSIAVPPMSLQDYAKRIFKYSQCTEECFPFALILINRYLMRQPEHILLSFYNSHRLFITSLMISAKLRDDEYYSNAYYSSIGGVTPLEMNALEVQFLKDIQWDLYVDPEEYHSVVLACEEKGYPDKMNHETMKFRENRERERAEQASNGIAVVMVAGSSNATVASPMSPPRSAPSQGEASDTKTVKLESAESSGGLSSSDSRPAQPSLSAVSSGQDVTMFMGSRQQQQPAAQCGDSAETITAGADSSKTRETPTRAYFDPMNYTTVPSSGGPHDTNGNTGGSNSSSAQVGKKRRRK